jgi:hypothetical protein
LLRCIGHPPGLLQIQAGRTISPLTTLQGNQQPNECHKTQPCVQHVKLLFYQSTPNPRLADKHKIQNLNPFVKAQIKTSLYKPNFSVENILAKTLAVCYSNFSSSSVDLGNQPKELETKSNKSALVLEATADEKFFDVKHRKYSGTETSRTGTPEFHYRVSMVEFWGFVYRAKHLIILPNLWGDVTRRVTERLIFKVFTPPNC